MSEKRKVSGAQFQKKEKKEKKKDQLLKIPTIGSYFQSKNKYELKTQGQMSYLV
jgi:hypothetical protein